MATQLTPKQEKRLNDIIDVMEKGPLGIAKMIFDLQNELDTREERMKAEIEVLRKANPDLNDILDQVKGKDASPDDVAERLKNDTNFVKKITPLVEDGKDYVLTNKDKEDISKSIKVPVVDRIVEKRTDIIHEQPIVKTEVIKETIKESNETGETIVDKINELEIQSDKQIDPEHIKGWKERMSKVERGLLEKGGVAGIKQIIAGSGISVDNSNFGYPVISSSGAGGAPEDLSSQISGDNRTFTATVAPRFITVDGTICLPNATGDSFSLSGLIITTDRTPVTNVFSFS